MFRPVKLSRVTIQVPEKYISAVMAILGDLRFLHLIRVEETPLGRLGYIAHIDSTLLSRYDGVLARINRLLEDLQYPGSPRIVNMTPRVDKLIFQLEEECTAIEKETLDTLEQRKELRSTLLEDRNLIARLSLLKPADLDLDRLNDLRYTTFHAGLIPEENLARLETSLSEIHHSLIPIDRQQGRTVLVAMALKEDEAILLRALKSAFWDPLQIPKELHGSVSTLLEQLTGKAQQIFSICI